jgi:periplasmic nitrate reductase NapD
MKDAIDQTRRNFLLGQLTVEAPVAPEQHISSIVVHSWPEQTDAVCDALATLEHVEIHARDPSGKLILVLETDDDSEVVERLNAIQSIPGVLSVALVFHHFEPTTRVT